MLKLRDFFHLPQVDHFFEQLVAGKSGANIVAGLDPRPFLSADTARGFLPSGRATIFRILMEEILEAHPRLKCLVITEDKERIRVPRQLRKRTEIVTANPLYTEADQIANALWQQPGLLAIERLSPHTASIAFDAARKGWRVLSQMDTVFLGAEVARQLRDWGIPDSQMRDLAWIVSVQRLATLCPHCKEPYLPNPDQLVHLQGYYADLAKNLGEDWAARWGRSYQGTYWTDDIASIQKDNQVASPIPNPDLEGSTYQVVRGEIGVFFRASGCSKCRNTGRLGDISAFDIFRSDPEASDISQITSQLPMKAYVLHLASLGRLSLEDFLEFETDQLWRTYNLFVASERAMHDANEELKRKIVELEASNRVLVQRTEALISLQSMSQALIETSELDELARQICQRSRDVCSADRAILYFHAPGNRAHVLASIGWDTSMVRKDIEGDLIFGTRQPRGLLPFEEPPPGVMKGALKDTSLRAGIFVPLIAEDRLVGAMIVHSTSKSRFSQRETSLLQTFANQAALAIQRAGLIKQLRLKIAELEAAQAGLAQKERLEREMELAREVQQSVLPRAFPQIPGYRFAALNEPARRVGGDFYDVTPLDESHFGVAIADVSDKGMPAALYMALTRSLLRAEAKREFSPRKVLENVNRLLMELGEPHLYVTVFYGVIDTASHVLTYARAGHDNPILIRNGSIHEIGGEGTALGLLSGDEFILAEEKISLKTSDRLVLYTDGLVDVITNDGKLYDRGQLKSLLQSHAGLSLASMCQAVFDELNRFRGTAEQYDDMTMLVMEIMDSS